MRKSIFLNAILGLIVILIFLLCLSGCNKTNDERVFQYEEMIAEVLEGDITVKENGCIALPQNMEHLSASGECFIVEFNGCTAIYFYSYRGVLDSSKGYLYITDKLHYEEYINTDSYIPTREFVNVVKIEDNLFSCSTN